MKIRNQIFAALTAGAFLAVYANAFALGSDYPTNRIVHCQPNWPVGITTLVNSSNRVWGFYVNAEDLFFYAGGPAQLTAFLQEYSRLEGIDNFRLILRDGVGDAKSPWEKTARPCDWELYVCSKNWHNMMVALKQHTNSTEVIKQPAQEPGYIVEVHFWTGGSIKLDQLDIPKNIVVQKDH